jgi:hypothetical protein
MPARRSSGRNRRYWARRSARPAIVVLTVIAVVLGSATIGVALPTKLTANGKLDFSYGSAVNSAGGPGTAYKPESKLFHTGDGLAQPVRWWAVLGTSGPSPAAGVWLWELVNHDWTPRVQLPDADPWAKADVVLDDGVLYVSTRDNRSITGNPRQSSLYEIAYQGGGAWGLPSGPFPITTSSIETLTLARDTMGRLWVTFESGGKIKVGSTAPGGTSFSYTTVSATNVKADDISAVTAFADKIGVAWSDQNARKDFFAWRSDAQAVDSPWTVETAYGGGVGGCPTATSALCADDHLNVKVAGSTIYVAIKTSLNDASPDDPSDPLVTLLRRTPDGTWSSFPVSTVAQDATRPVTVLSPDQNAIWVFATRGSEVDVWESAFDAPGFTSTAFSPWLKASSRSMNDATSTKQVTTSLTGTVVMASVKGRTEYWHNEFLPAP